MKSTRRSALVAHLRRYERLFLHALQAGILILLLWLWQVGADRGVINTFLFASPYDIYEVLLRDLRSGALLNNVSITMLEIILGFLIGAIGGSVIGLGLWYSQFVARLTEPFIAALGSVPILAIAPLIIIWFGTGITSKIVIVAASCIVVSLLSSYNGAREVDKDAINLLRSFGATKNQIFKKIVVPSSLTWVFSGLKLNIGFALIGAIVGEFISSDQGVGHEIVVGSANFAIDVVLAGIFVVIVMAAVLYAVIRLLELKFIPWK